MLIKSNITFFLVGKKGKEREKERERKGKDGRKKGKVREILSDFIDRWKFVISQDKMNRTEI